MAANSPSQQYQWWLSNGSVIVEAFERCGKLSSSLERRHWISARTSLNLLLVDWTNRQGVNLWKVMGPTQINLIQGQATYTVPTNCAYLLDMYYTQANGAGAGVNSDRIMVPISRTEYAEYPNKLQQGTPTVFWYQKETPVPQFTIYQAPQFAAPDYVLNYYWLSRVMDANVGGGESPDVPYLAMEALCAGLALQLARKPTLTGRLDPALFADIKENAAATWLNFSQTDREDVPLHIMPQMGGYFRDR